MRAADAMIALTMQAKPPRHLVLGAWGYEAVTARLAERLAEIETFKDMSLAADFPKDTGR